MKCSVWHARGVAAYYLDYVHYHLLDWCSLAVKRRLCCCHNPNKQLNHAGQPLCRYGSVLQCRLDSKHTYKVLHRFCARLVAGYCPLQELPETLLYEITKCLDVVNQRNLFMASAQLYKKWRMQILEADHDWHFLSYALNLLAQTAAEGSCNMKLDHTFVQACFGHTGHKADICGRIKDDRAEFMMRVIPRNDGLCTAYSRQARGIFSIFTTDSALKRCTSAPPLTSANMVLESRDPISQEELKALAQHFFSLLQNNDGFLVLLFAGDAANLLVIHTEDGWTIDNEPCIVAPPVLDMNAIPREVIGVRARLYSKGSHAVIGFMSALHKDSFHASEGVDFDLECEPKVKFAYNHNIDIDAWVNKQHEQANDFYYNIDDFEAVMMGEDGFASDASDEIDSHGDHSGEDNR